MRRLLITFGLAMALLGSGCIVHTHDRRGPDRREHPSSSKGKPRGCKVNGAGKTVCPPGHNK